jgi:hypothetical protein
MKPEEYDQQAIAEYNRKQQLREAIRNAPKAVRRALAAPVGAPHPIIVAKGKPAPASVEWSSWHGTKR